MDRSCCGSGTQTSGFSTHFYWVHAGLQILFVLEKRGLNLKFKTNCEIRFDRISCQADSAAFPTGIPAWGGTCHTPYPSVLDFWQNQVRRTGFLVYFKMIFTVCVACKSQFQNWFLQVKIQFVKLDFLNLISQRLSTVQMDRAIVETNLPEL